MALAFGFMPFVYFLFEEEDEDSTFAQQACGALKYTLAFIVIFAVLLVLGLVLKGGQFENNDDTPWVDKFKGSFGGNAARAVCDCRSGLMVTHELYVAGESVMSWCISCLATLGLLGWVIYTVGHEPTLP